MSVATVASPCTQVCVIDAGTDWCRGCARTLDEIARWGVAGDDERRAVLARLPARKRVMAAVGR